MDSPQLSLSLRPGITGVVLTSEGGERLASKCFASLAFCDTLLVVDSGSTDATMSIARAQGATVVSRQWEGFASQFTFAQGLVETRWFFVLDQDEICPLPLATALTAAVAQAEKADGAPGTPVAFSVGRMSWYFDKFMRHGGWYPDHILRLFRTGKVEFYQDAHIHYRALGPTAHVGTAGAEIVHYPYTGFFHQLAKLNTYAQQGADHLRANKKKGGICKGLGHGFWRFLRIYLLKRGFLDGKAGFLAASHGAIYAFLKYTRALDASWGAPFDKP